MRRQLLLFFARRLPSSFFTRPSSPPPRNVAPLSHNFRHAHGAHACACILWNSKGVVFSLPFHSWPTPLVDNPFSPVFRHFFLETGSLHKAPWHCVEAGFNQGLTCTRDVYSAEYRGRIIKCINSRVFFEPSFFFFSPATFFSPLPSRPFLLLALTSDHSQSLRREEGGKRVPRVIHVNWHRFGEFWLRVIQPLAKDFACARFRSLVCACLTIVGQR